MPAFARSVTGSPRQRGKGGPFSPRLVRRNCAFSAFSVEEAHDADGQAKFIEFIVAAELFARGEPAMMEAPRAVWKRQLPAPRSSMWTL